MIFSLNIRCAITQIFKNNFYIKQLFLIHTDVRVRFAPSPTGSLHIGGARTALYNYLYAKRHGGKFILRIEDTNALKSISNVDVEIENDLHWLKIIPDESPLLGGDYGPYNQSKRLLLYTEHANILLSNDCAYKCFCTADRLEKIKQENKFYDNHCRVLSPDNIKSNEDKGLPFCIRFKTQKTPIKLDDMLLGKRVVQSATEGDPIIMKSSGYPTFFLASVVDDHMMNISHIFRGIEWMSSANLVMSIYKAFGWPAPKFGHLPQLLNVDRSKLSKRKGATSIVQLRQEGYSPEVILNTAISTGGGFKKHDTFEFLSIPDMIAKFSIEKLSTCSAHLEFEKFNKYSHIELHNKLKLDGGEQDVINELRKLIILNYSTSSKVDLNDKYLSNVLIWSKARTSNLTQLSSSDYYYLWTDNIKHDANLVQEFSQEEIAAVFSKLYEALRNIDEDQFSIDNMKSYIRNALKMNEKDSLKILRVSMCGKSFGPPMSEIFTLLGKTEVLNRLKNLISLYS